MRRIRLAGLNCRNILPKTVDSFLSDLDLQYNWPKKVKGVVLGICLARSLVLQDIARKHGGKVKKTEKSLSEFLSCKRLNLRDSSSKCAVQTLRRLGRRRFFWYRGKLVLLIDSTTYAKVIVVADQGFRRKDLLELLKEHLKTDFVIRLNGNLRVEACGWNNLLQALGPHWRERLQRHWRDDTKNPLLSSVGAAAVEIPLPDHKSLHCNALCLTPLNRKDMAPLFLATTLPIEHREHLSKIVTLYSCRWAIETFFFSFKQSLRAEGFRVFSCWEAIDRLLTMAHMAFLILHLLFVLGQSSTEGMWQEFWRHTRDLLHGWFARPPELTLGYFFEITAKDYGKCRWAWEVG